MMVGRQLRDIQQNMYLTELVSHERESIQGQLHHTRCIYNALADVKPEVEATIKTIIIITIIMIMNIITTMVRLRPLSRWAGSWSKQVLSPTPP